MPRWDYEDRKTDPNDGWDIFLGGIALAVFIAIIFYGLGAVG